MPKSKPQSSAAAKSARSTPATTAPAKNKPQLKKEEPQKRLPKEENSTLPLVSVLHKSLMKDATKLLVEAHELKDTKDKAEIRIKEIKETLAAIAMSEDLSGLRYGKLGIQVNGYTTRKNFSKKKATELMLEHGIAAEEINTCYEESEEYLDTKLVTLL